MVHIPLPASLGRTQTISAVGRSAFVVDECDEEKLCLGYRGLDERKKLTRNGLLASSGESCISASPLLFFVECQFVKRIHLLVTRFLSPDQIITVLIPLVVGKVIREAVPGAKPWVKRFKVRLSLTSSAMLIMVVWQTLSRAQSDLTSVEFTQILSVIAAGICLHLV